MIQANELRIGNYYDQFGNIHQATWNTIKELSEAPPTQLWCKPIPLTEEWHNRFGVELNGFKQFEYSLSLYKKVVFSNDYVFLVDIDRVDGVRSVEDNVCTLWSDDLRGRKMYVHEWMNLYHALTGTELTLKPDSHD